MGSIVFETDKNRASAWVQCVYSEAAKNERINTAKSDGSYTDRWDRLQYQTAKILFKLKEQELTVTLVLQYADTGTVLNTSSQVPKHSPIPSRFFGRVLFDHCKNL